MSVKCLTEQQEEVFRQIAKQDLRLWPWTSWAKRVANDGKCPAKIEWVILPYRTEKVMPLLRKEMNQIYKKEAELIAEEYGFRLTLDPVTNKIVIFDPLQFDANLVRLP